MRRNFRSTSSPKQRAPRRGFDKLVKSAPDAPIALPLTHVTDGYSFRDIMETETLAPSHCTIFDSDLVYLFYGRPAYRTAVEVESSGTSAYWPICFVLAPDAASPARIFPFDSGAFHHGRFGRFTYHKMIKEDFELSPDPKTPGRLLRLFWEDEKSYFNATGHKNFIPNALDFEATAYSELLRDRGNGPYDERNSAIEIQVAQPIELPGRTVAVILPHAFATPDILSKIEGMGALALPFDLVPRQSPNEMVGLIYATVRDLLGGKWGRGRCW